MSTQETMSTPLTFGELEKGDKFIGFPLDGDDSGHGGFRGAHYVFIKLSGDVGSRGENAIRQCDGTLSGMPSSMKVIKIT